jgi:hypothetical protein
MNTNPHYENVQRAQIARLAAHKTALDPAGVLAALDAMPADVAYDTVREALARAVRRRMIEAHERPVEGVPV